MKRIYLDFKSPLHPSWFSFEGPTVFETIMKAVVILEETLNQNTDVEEFKVSMIEDGVEINLTMVFALEVLRLNPALASIQSMTVHTDLIEGGV